MCAIVELSEKKDMFNRAVQFFWKQDGNETSFKFYEDCMYYSCHTKNKLPRFYLLLKDQHIVGSYALLINDLSSRQDLFPWLGSLYVVPEYRRKGFGSKLQKHAVKEAKKKGFNNIYLSTSLGEFYENNDWTFLSTSYLFNGDPVKIYERYTFYE